MPEAEIFDGAVKLYYEIHGQGPEKVLLVMGLGTSAMAWEATVEWLLRHESRYQFCIFDNRGVGRSSVPPGRYTTTEMAQDALQLVVRVLGWTKFHLVGVSMGGMISQEIASAVPSKILSLSLVVTHSGGPGSGTNLKTARLVLKSLAAKTIDERIAITLQLMFSEEWLEKRPADSGEYPSNREMITERMRSQIDQLPQPNPKGVRGQVLAVKTHKLGDKRLQTLAKQPFPILICTGTNDMLVNPKASAFLNKVLRPAEYIVWEGAGHGVLTERFEEFNQAIVRNFKRAQQADE